MLINPTTVGCLIVLTALFLSQATSATKDKFGTETQIRSEGIGGDVLSFWSNWTNVMSLIVANVLVSYIVGAHATSWTILQFAGTFGVVSIAQAFGAIVPLLKDSAGQPETNFAAKKDGTPSAFYRDGLLALAGAMQYQLFNIQTTVIVAYYLFTPRQDVSHLEVGLVTIAAVVNWGVSVLQPPYKAHGEINAEARMAALGGWIALFLLALYLLPAA